MDQFRISAACGTGERCPRRWTSRSAVTTSAMGNYADAPRPGAATTHLAGPGEGGEQRSGSAVTGNHGVRRSTCPGRGRTWWIQRLDRGLLVPDPVDSGMPHHGGLTFVKGSGQLDGLAALRWGQSEGPPDAADRVWLSPLRWAMDRVLRWVARPGAAVSSVSVITRSTSSGGNRSRPSAARFVRQSVQPPFQESGTAISAPRLTDTPRSRLVTNGIAAGSAQPKMHSGRSAKAWPFSDGTHRYQGFTLRRRHPKLAMAGIGRPIAMVILPGLLTSEDTSSRTITMNFSYTTLESWPETDR